MTKYIDRDAALAVLEDMQKSICPVGRWSRNAVSGSDRDAFDALEEKIEEMNSIPAADVVEVRHGRWIWDARCCKWECSECGGKEGECGTPICKWCGARMDKEDEHADTP